MVKRLFAYIGQYKKYVISCIFLMTFDVLCEMMMPFLMAKIVDVGIPQKDIAFIARVGGLMIVLALAAIGFGVLNMRFSANASQGFAANIRRALFDKVQSFSFSNIDYFSTASLVTRLTNDVTQMQVMLLMSLRILLRAPLMLITACFFAMSINLKLSGIILIAMPVLVISIYFVIRSAEHLFSTMQQRLDSLNNTVRENLIAIRVVKAFVREEYEKLKFKKVNDAFTKAAINAGYLISLAMPVILFILNFTTIAVIWFGGKMVSTGTMGTGELIGFISYVMQILTSTMIFSMVFILYARAEASAQRIVEVLDAKVDIADKPALPEGGITPSVSSGKVEFRNVYFRYGNSVNSNGSANNNGFNNKMGKDVLSDITFNIESGEIVGIIGGTGSGKTSLISLIPRLYDVTAGQVLVDGTDVRDYNLKTLRDGIGIVLQTNVLFSGTIRENLLWGNENAAQEEIEEAARNAQAHDFIMSFPDGYDTILGQAGVNLSGGQKQRLCIARALLKKPYILILDDSTSSVDVATEAKIMESFNKNLKESTIIIISQRISSIKEADKIIVLDDGKISGIGTHEMLYESNTIYREIYDTQQGGLIL
ncbi:MAG: ABC transporter ATP-binding protein [Actinomycetota bacterium]|nr:ABC transporter ATP-binding protein [Actinomycetota bacterium]